MKRKREEARRAAEKRREDAEARAKAPNEDTESRARASEKDAEVEEQIRDVLSALRGLGVKGEQARRAAAHARALEHATLADRIRAALQYHGVDQPEPQGRAGHVALRLNRRAGR
jgi:Holliday junction resolvasome RuvABC DNA-binding subunit